MTSKVESRSLRELFCGFCDETTKVWIEAAREIGRLAAQGNHEAQGLYTRWFLMEVPGNKSVGANLTSNIHRDRHAHCSLAAQLSAPPRESATSEPSSTLLPGHGEAVARGRSRAVEAQLRSLCLYSLIERGCTVGDLDRIPGARAELEEWLEQKRTTLRGRLARATTANARTGIQKALEALVGTTDRTVIEALKWKKVSPDWKGLKKWQLTSYIAGVEHPRALFGLSVELVVECLSRVEDPVLCVNLPLLLPVAPESKRGVLVAQLDAVDTTGKHWESGLKLNFLLGIAEQTPDFDFRSAWTRGLPDASRWEARLDVAFSPDSPEVARLRLSRELLNDLPADDWEWKESTATERFGLDLLCLLLLRPQASAQDHWPFARNRSREKEAESLEHRIVLTMSALQRSRHSQIHLVPQLVRCLKQLLDEQLRDVVHRERSGGKVLQTAREQVHQVRYLLRWDLGGITEKDLATIVARTLMSTYDATPSDFVDLLYTILYALPGWSLLKTSLEYCSTPEVSEVLEEVVGLLRDLDALRTVPIRERESKVDDLFDRHEDLMKRLVQSGCSELTFANRDLRELSALQSITAEAPKAPAEAESAEQAAISPSGALGCQGEIGGNETALTYWLQVQSRANQIDEAAKCSGTSLVQSTSSLRAPASTASVAEVEASSARSRVEIDRIRRRRRSLDESYADDTSSSAIDGSQIMEVLRDLVSQTEVLRESLRLSLSPLEYHLFNAATDEQIELLRRREEELQPILGDANEELARNFLEQRVTESPLKRETLLVHRWMAERYMLSELAQLYDLRWLGWFSNWRVAGAWIVAPFLLCMVLTRLGLGLWAGMPFAVAAIANIVVFGLFGRDTRPLRARGLPTGQLFLPKVLGALFLGVQSIIAADENWAVAFLEYPWFRFVTWVGFLAGAFYFTRELVVPRRLNLDKRTKRALQVMSMGLWQAFAIVCVFGVMGGLVMGGRSEIGLGDLGGASQLLGSILPNEVGLGPWFLQPLEQPVTADSHGAYRIFPWALASWTLQLYFFSAIIERILGGGDD